MNKVAINYLRQSQQQTAQLVSCSRESSWEGSTWYPLQGVKAISGKRFKLIYIVLILLVMKQMMYQKEALDVSFILTPWKWAATPSCPKKTFFTPRGPLLFAASRCDAPLIMPRPFLGCQIKAEIKGFLLRYHLFLYYSWFFQNIKKDWRKFFEKDYFGDFPKNILNGPMHRQGSLGHHF